MRNCYLLHILCKKAMPRMKPKLILLLISFLPLFAVAQDSLIQKRFKEYPNPLKLGWHKSVRAEILDLTGPNKTKLEEAFGKGAHFAPLIDSLLKKANLPTDLFYYALASSGMQFDYFDTLDGARGIWHFNYTQARLFGLKITSYVDERLDPTLSTHAFIRAIKEYHKIYQNWELALAAFVSSAPQVNKAIRYHGDTTNYWVIREDLSGLASAIVSKTLANALLYKYATDFQIKPKAFRAPVAAKKIQIGDWYSLDLLAVKAKISPQTLAFLNPTYKRHVIPDMPDSFPLILPESLKDSVQWVKSIRYVPYDAEYFEGGGTRIAEAPQMDTLEHTVQEGETLEAIANIYQVKVADIQEWNILEGEDVIANQKLIILKEIKPTPKPKPQPKPKPEYRVHTVRSGDTLSGIATKYKCTVTEIKKWNNLKSTVIRPGQKLKIY